jgi:hypothetical protein
MILKVNLYIIFKIHKKINIKNCFKIANLSGWKFDEIKMKSSETEKRISYVSRRDRELKRASFKKDSE